MTSSPPAAPVGLAGGGTAVLRWSATARFDQYDRVASNLHRNADGSIDLYIQHTQPTDPVQAQNWLPAPAGTFRVFWRLYDTEGALPGILDGSGWQPPALQPCTAGHGAPLMTACAS